MTIWGGIRKTDPTSTTDGTRTLNSRVSMTDKVGGCCSKATGGCGDQA